MFCKSQIRRCHSFYSPILFSLDMIKEGQRGKGLWKFNSSLSSNKRYARNVKNHITTTTIFLNEENIFDDQKDGNI